MKAYRYFHTEYISLGTSKATLLGLLCAISLWFFGPRTALSQNSVQRDQQAITILTQTIAAGGGQQALAAIQDFTETGTITYNFADPVTGNITVKSRGLHRFRIDADLPEGKRSTVVNGDGGSLTQTNGRVRLIHRQNAHDLGSFTLPYLPLIASIRDSTTSIIYFGLVTHDGAPKYYIQLQKVYARLQDSTGNRGAKEVRDYYIDPTTSLVTSVSERISLGRARDAGITREDFYSHYQPENGIMMPLTIAETVQGVPGFTMTLSQVTFNSGLADSDFTW
jgi:outer membrane lipoprotein-sorting protein